MIKCPNNKNCKKTHRSPSLSITCCFELDDNFEYEMFDFNFSNKDNKFELISGAPMRG